MRIFVTLVGDSRLAACASATGMRLHSGLLPRIHEPAASDPAAPTSDFVNVLRPTFIRVLHMGPARCCSGCLETVRSVVCERRSYKLNRVTNWMDRGEAAVALVILP